MAPSKVTNRDILKIWKRLQERGQRIRSARVKYRVGQHVRISKEKMIFAKGATQNYTTEIFKIIKVIPKSPRPVYELEDLNQTSIENQFYAEELTPVRISKRTTYKIDKILDRRVRRGILEYLVKWQGYTYAFNSWVPASSVKNI
jgi:dTDP-glucose pyrophosphorylase